MQRTQLVSCMLEEKHRNTPPQPISAGGLPEVGDNLSHQHGRQRAMFHHSFPSCPALRVGNELRQNLCRPCLLFPPSYGTQNIRNSRNQCNYHSLRVVQTSYQRCWRGVTDHTATALLRMSIGPHQHQGWKFSGMALHRRWNHQGRIGPRFKNHFIDITRRKRWRLIGQWASGKDL